MTASSSGRRSHAMDRRVQGVRLADIARRTGYSLATVSKVLNGHPDVSAETRKRIDTELRASGYSRHKRHLYRTSRCIEVVLESLDTVWGMELLRGMVTTAKLFDVSVVVTQSGSREHVDPQWVDDVAQRRPIGAILVFSELTDSEHKCLSDHDIPYVILDPSGEPSSDSISVQADNWRGGVIATKHLLDLGHTRIGIITGPRSMFCSRARLSGYMSALEEKGILHDSTLIREGDFRTQSGYEQAMSLLRDVENRPTAIFGGSGLQCMGVYEAARQLGLRIPEDLSVVGFDDIQTSEFMGPPLTTVHQPLQEMASLATRLIMDIHANRVLLRTTILPVGLVVRNSTCAPRTVD